MNVAPLSMDKNSFNGYLKVNNFKTNKVSEFKLDDKLCKSMIDTFAGKEMLNNRLFHFNGRSFEERLYDLKRFVKFFDTKSKTNFEKELTYPTAKDYSARYKATKNSAEIDIPKHFNINITY